MAATTPEAEAEATYAEAGAGAGCAVSHGSKSTKIGVVALVVVAAVTDTPVDFCAPLPVADFCAGCFVTAVFPSARRWARARFSSVRLHTRPAAAAAPAHAAATECAAMKRRGLGLPALPSVFESDEDAFKDEDEDADTAGEADVEVEAEVADADEGSARTVRGVQSAIRTAAIRRSQRAGVAASTERPSGDSESAWRRRSTQTRNWRDARMGEGGDRHQ